MAKPTLAQIVFWSNHPSTKWEHGGLFSKVDPEGWGPRIVGGDGRPNLEKGRPRRVGPRRVTRFFFLSRHHFFLCFSGCSWNFGGVLKRRCPEMCTFGVLGLSCASPGRPGLVGPPGSHTTAREPKRAHFRVPAFKTPPKFNEKTPRERQKERIRGREREKKAQNFGRSGGGGSSGGDVRRKVVQGSPKQQQPQPQQRQTQKKWGPEGSANSPRV